MGIGIPAGWEIFNGGCPPIETVGACCLPGGSCTSVTEDQCIALDGVYLGDGEVCSPDPCEGTGGTIPPAGTTVTTFQSCENVFSRTLSLSDACGDSDFVGDPPNLSPWYYSDDRGADITVSSNSSTPCYGITFTYGIGGYNTLEFVEAYVAYKGSTGTPSAGVCISSSGTDTSSITTFAIITDFNTGITRLVQFTNNDIASYTNGTTLYSASFTPSVGNIFYFQMYKDLDGFSPFNGLYAAVLAGSGDYSTEVWGFGDSFTPNIYPKYNLGLIATGDATGTMSFGVDGTCATGSRSMYLFGNRWVSYPPDV